MTHVRAIRSRGSGVRGNARSPRATRRAADGPGVNSLTTREREIARRIVDRRTNRQTAEEL